MFLCFVYSEGIPYQFLFEGSSEKVNENYSSSFHRLVPCLFNFRGSSKTIYVSIPQSDEYEKSREQAYLLETIKSHYQEVNDYAISNNSRIYLSDETGKIVDIDNIYKHYASSVDEDSLKDPFKAQTKVFAIFKANILTTQCDLVSTMGLFMSDLITKTCQSDQSKDFSKIQTVFELILTLISSQLYYMDKSFERIDYECYKISPAVDILMGLDRDLCQQFVGKLLEVIIKN